MPLHFFVKYNMLFIKFSTKTHTNIQTTNSVLLNESIFRGIYAECKYILWNC